MSGWVAVDLDGTLAHYDPESGTESIGEPIDSMARRVSEWLSRGVDVRIMTARANPSLDAAVREKFVLEIQDWTEKHFGTRLPVTSSKDFGMLELWDDRAVCVEHNTGRILGRNG